MFYVPAVYIDFSVALNRGSFAAQENSTVDPGLGYLSFGGIAPVKTTKTSVTSPVVGLQASSGAVGYFFYVVEIEKYIFPGSAKLNTESKTTILDTGTTLNYIPTDAAAAYAAAFVPKAVNSDYWGGYIVECDAKVPEFEVVVGGVTFSVAAADQLLPLGETNKKGKEICFLGTQDGGAGDRWEYLHSGRHFLAQRCLYVQHQGLRDHVDSACSLLDILALQLYHICCFGFLRLID